MPAYLMNPEWDTAEQPAEVRAGRILCLLPVSRRSNLHAQRGMQLIKP